jgi:hypothetical protein
MDDHVRFSGTKYEKGINNKCGNHYKCGAHRLRTVLYCGHLSSAPTFSAGLFLGWNSRLPSQGNSSFMPAAERSHCILSAKDLRKKAIACGLCRWSAHLGV